MVARTDFEVFVSFVLGIVLGAGVLLFYHIEDKEIAIDRVARAASDMIVAAEQRCNQEPPGTAL